MAGDGDGTSSKSARNNAQSSTPSQEPQQPPAAAPTPPAYAEWAAALHQAYYASASASSGGTAPIPPPPPHPYIWPSQFMPPPPYGAIPPPQGAVYPAPFGGFYLHHSLPPPSHLSYNPYGAYNSNPEAAVVANPLATAESSDVKTGDGKEQKKPSPSLGKVSGGGNSKESLPSEPANGSHSRSGESGSEGSSEDSEDAPPNSFHLAQDNRGEHQLNLNDGTEAFHPSIIATGAKPMAMAASSSVPTTSLNIGMDYWSGATSAQMPGMYAGGVKRKGTSVNHSEFWDEREVKRQRRKQSNRESARRSRLRKQAEYEEVTKIAAEQRAENESLRSKLDNLREDYKRLVSTNETLRAQLRCDNAGNGILQEHKAVENDSVQEEGKRREMVNTGNNEGGGVHVEICINNNDPARSSNQGEDRDNSNRTPPQLHKLISKKRLLMNLQPPFNPSVSAK